MQPLSPDAWIASSTAGTLASTRRAPQTLESVRAALKSEAQGTWVVVVLRKGCDDVVEVELSMNGDADAQGGGARQRPAKQAECGQPFGAAALQHHLLAHLVQASAPDKASWQSKAARVWHARTWALAHTRSLTHTHT